MNISKFFQYISCTILFILLFNLITSGEPASDLKIGKPAPNFYLKTLNNEDVFLSNLCGKKKLKYPVLISFWATYCKPCKKEFPIFSKISDKYTEKGLKIFLINVREPKERVETFIKENNITVPVLLDTYAKIAEKYNSHKSVPNLFLIDKNGIIVQIYNGGITEKEEEDLTNKIEELLE